MDWTVEIVEEFEPELLALPLEVRRTVLALSRLLGHFGPQLGRPRVDTLNGSRHANMKEMRFRAADGEWQMNASTGTSPGSRRKGDCDGPEC